ncbi:MAG: hypothetical protein M1835_003420 [Candelina submexicana]|nr:MAG: hypothetical protein M1835_003420 [Candelina submexicana]
MLNPLYFFVPPFLVLISIPLASFAILTSTLAFSTLLLRVLAVYVELGFAIAHNYFFLTPSSKPVPQPRKSTSNATPNPSSTQAPPQRRRKRRSSAGSTNSDQGTSSHTLKPKDTFIGLGLSKEPSMERDFEGVGGWRFPSATDPAFEDSLWTSMNSRLELPAATALPPKRHRRSLTSGSLSGEGRRGRRGSGIGHGSSTPMDHMAMSPMQVQTKTPPVGRASPEGYFSAKMTAKSNSALDTFGRERGLVRGHRKSSSSSTGSSGKGIQLATK